MKYCTKCGAALEDDAKFCTNCGQAPDNEEVQAEAPQAQAPVPPVYGAGAAQPQAQTPPQTSYQANTTYRANVPPTYNPTPQPGRTLVFGRLSFIFGLIGLILSGLFGLIGLFTMGIGGVYCWFGICLGIAGLVMGIIGKKKNPDDQKARTGFTLSLVAIIAGFVLFIIGIVILASAAGSSYRW